jgi:hypothetical protein
MIDHFHSGPREDNHDVGDWDFEDDNDSKKLKSPDWKKSLGKR